ncbi:MAG TPA: chromosome segregation protein, partial [Sphingomicrobium sp.]|nr:chromosome segregation protein [Sphingomicrobium sp.]
YRIDGRDVRAKDIALLFADAATGAHSPALVSQGRIGAVIAAKPVERRQLLEEAAGISGLHVRRKDAEQKLRATEANLARLAEILNDQEQRATQLRRQARAAERYRKLAEQIRGLEGRLLYTRWLDAERTAEAAAAEASAAAEEVERIQQAISAAQAALEAANIALAEKRSALTELREQGHGLAHQLAAARARRDTVTRRLNELDRLDSSLVSDIQREEALKRDAAQAITQLYAERTVISLRLEEAETYSTRIASELGAAEATSRDSEASLAELLARQAAMRAERRVAEAALEASRAQLGRTEMERQKLAEQLGMLGDGSEQVGARTDAEAKAKVASRALGAAEASRVEAEQGRARAAEVRDLSESALSSARAALSAVRSEHDALARALEQGSGAAIASLKAEPGYERALAAALGEDSDAAIGNEGPRRWEGSETLASDPALPTGTKCLADHVRAPVELLRRLKQVAVAEIDQGQDLGVGQRLVTLDGRLRRWDGFVAMAGGAAAAERLVRTNRLVQLGEQLPGLEVSVSSAATEREQALGAMERCRKSAEEARTAALSAERDAREAARAIDTAAAALERIEAQRANLLQRQEDIAPVLDAAREAVAAAELSLGSLPDPATLENEVEMARAAAGSAASRVADKRAEAATKARETANDRERFSTSEREQNEWRKRQGDAEQRLASAVERQCQQAAERTILEKEPDELDARIRELEHSNDQSQVRIGEGTSAERDAESAVISAGQQVSAANERSADTRELRAAAAARAEAQQARSAELARESLNKFECIPQRLPEKHGFDADQARNIDEEARTLERLVAERERIGPVNLVAETEL